MFNSLVWLVSYFYKLKKEKLVFLKLLIFKTTAANLRYLFVVEKSIPAQLHLDI
jgi:hypothetical protein